MITLNNNEANTIITYYDAPEQYFLFEFKSGVNCQPIYLLPENISACDDYQKFVINRNFGFGGVWTVNIYNQSSPTNTNPANATLLATEQVAIVIDEDCFNTPPVIVDPCPQINPADFSCEELLTPYTGLTETQIECILATLSCEYLREVLTYEQIECFGPPLSGYTCEQLLEGLTESQLSCLLRSFDCEFLNDPYLGLTRNQLACLPDKPIDLHTCEELLDPYTGLTNDQKICILQALPCSLVADEYNGLTYEQKACVIPTLSCDILEANLTQEQINCLIQLQYDVDYRAILNYATVQGDTQPSDVNKLVQNDLMINLKAAATNGLSDYSLIRVWGNDINHSPIPANLGFDGYNWANVGSNQAQRVNTLTKVLKQGYHGNGVDAYVDENWNPSTSGLVKTDFLWFVLYYANGIGGQSYRECLTNDNPFDKFMQISYINNPSSLFEGQLFRYEAALQSYAAFNNAPTYQRMIFWRTGNNLYLMINGTQYGPFNNGFDSDLPNGNFLSFTRSIIGLTNIEFMSNSYVKNVWGFAKQSTINKSLLDAALATYANAVY